MLIELYKKREKIKSSLYPFLHSKIKVNRYFKLIHIQFKSLFLIKLI